MRVIRVHQYGGPEMLCYDEVPLPQPGVGEARVRIEAVGVNYVDIYQRTGQYPDQLPMTLEREAAGAVDAVGQGVEYPAWRPRRLRRAGGVEWGVCDPPGVDAGSDPERPGCSAGGCGDAAGLTAHYLTHSTYPLQPGETVLIHAAAGGVGLLLAQMAKRRGARVIGTVSTEEKARLANGAGAGGCLLGEKCGRVRGRGI